MNNIVLSIYIPRMQLNISEEILRKELENTIGKIHRIDFTCKDKKPGFHEVHNYIYKSAFIHFSFVYKNILTNNILYCLNLEKGNFKYYPVIVKEYWLLLKTKNPIPDTYMNNCQIVENARLLENRIEENEIRFKNQEDRLSEQENKISYLENQINILIKKDSEENTNHSLYLKNNFINISGNSSINNDSIDENEFWQKEEKNIDLNLGYESNDSEERIKRRKISYEICGNE